MKEPVFFLSSSLRILSPCLLHWQISSLCLFASFLDNDDSEGQLGSCEYSHYSHGGKRKDIPSLGSFRLKRPKESESVGRSVISDSVTPWTVAHQAPLSMGFSRQEQGSGLPFPSPGDLPGPGIEPLSPHSRQILYHLSQRGRVERT